MSSGNSETMDVAQLRAALEEERHKVTELQEKLHANHEIAALNEKPKIQRTDKLAMSSTTLVRLLAFIKFSIETFFNLEIFLFRFCVPKASQVTKQSPLIS
jgi:hypothetical protein